MLGTSSTYFLFFSSFFLLLSVSFCSTSQNDERFSWRWKLIFFFHTRLPSETSVSVLPINHVKDASETRHHVYVMIKYESVVWKMKSSWEKETKKKEGSPAVVQVVRSQIWNGWFWLYLWKITNTLSLHNCVIFTLLCCGVWSLTLGKNFALGLVFG